MGDSNNNDWVGRLILGLMGIVFITLKLLGIIDWPWWVVTMPLWIGLAIFVLVIVIGVIAIFISKAIRSR